MSVRSAADPVCGCLNLLALGVVGEYMARIFDEIKARPRYVIAQMVNMRNDMPLQAAFVRKPD